MLKKRGRKFFPPFEFLVIERFHISQNLHKSILPITGVYLNMNRGTLSRQALLIYSFSSCRAKQNSMICLSSCTVNALPFFAEYRSESIRNQKGERVFQRRRKKFIDLMFPKLPNRKKIGENLTINS